MGDGPTDVRALRRAMKKARKAWRANKDDKTLRKEFRKRKKALLAAKAAVEANGGAKPTKKKTKDKGDKRKASDTNGSKIKKRAKTTESKAANVEGGSGGASAAEIRKFREEHKITLTGAPDNHKPVLSFSNLNISAKYLTSCKGFTKPTPIQAEAWPLAMAGRDVIGIAATGSGKTLGFTLPALPKIYDAKLGTSVRDRGPLMLVLSPTRELAQQTHKVCEQVCGSLGVESVCVIGGVDKRTTAAKFRRGYKILVATPGRLLGFIREREVDLGQVEYAVLDEADRMLDLGFEPDVRAIMERTQRGRQTMLFSATWPPEVQKLGLEFVTNPVIITVGDRANQLVANHRVSQTIEVIEDRQRDWRIHELLQKYHNRKNRVLVFCLYKKETARVEEMLRRKGWKVQSIHGNKTQADRSACLRRFKDGSEPLLVATDVAARGLDVDGVEVVLNYAFPLTVEDYVHRIGRTGRAGKSGISHTFFTLQNKSLSGELIQVLREAKQPVPEELLAFGTGTKRKKHPMYGDHYRADDGRPMPKAQHIKF